jgi:hypothetical protein
MIAILNNFSFLLVVFHFMLFLYIFRVELTMSQFDDLLDFNDTSAGSGTVQKTNDFDPFGPSPSVDGDLLVDFGFTGQVITNIYTVIILL